MEVLAGQVPELEARARAVAPVEVVHLLERLGDPAHLGLDAHDRELRVAVEEARDDELAHDGRKHQHAGEGHGADRAGPLETVEVARFLFRVIYL